MIHTDNPLWQRIFGSVWHTLTDCRSDIGGFIIDHENKKVYADSNAAALARLPDEPDYGETTLLVARLMEESKNASPLAVKICEYSDSITAGFFTSEEEAGMRGRMLFPVCTEAKLTNAVNDFKGRSLFALIQLEDSSSSSLSDFHIFSALSAIRAAIPANGLIASYSRERYWLFIPCSDIVCTDGETPEMQDRNYLLKLQKAVEECELSDEAGEAMGSHTMTFTAGCGADGVPAGRRMNTAEFALFEATGKGRGSVCSYSSDLYEDQKNEYGCMKRFSQLIENNLFVYHFQPIVSAHTGEVLAYETLMRTDESIGMYPLEILGAATRYGRLYDIEKATLFNAMAFIGENQDVFAGRRLFVNSITAHMLSDSDWETLENRYGELMEKVVIELTEQTEVDDDTLDLIHDRLRRCNMSLAIDDYGTGYSNTSNLLRYAPHYVKIDRSLITEIQDKPRLQKLVAGIIDFVHDNGYQALAEGVETSDELRCMIQLGSDLIQGYYVSKPKPVIIHEVAGSVREEIKRINEEYANDIAKIYRADDGEEIRISDLVSERYSSVLAGSGSLVIDGGDSGEVSVLISVKDESELKLTLRDVNIACSKADAIIALGEGVKAEICIEGENSLIGRGIYVPRSSSVTFTGGGKLKIMCESIDAYCVGVGKASSPGSICFDSPGIFDFISNGEHSVAVGGGKNDSGLAITMNQGQFSIRCSGNSCVGVGIASGGSVVNMNKISLNVEISAPDAVGIGSLSGSVNISMVDYRASFNFSGMNMCGIGTITDGSGDIDLENGKLDMMMRGRSINCVGSRKGSIDCRVKHSDIRLECEGNSASGIGDILGDGDVYISEGSVDITFRTGDGMGLGSRDGVLTVENLLQNIDINS